MQFSSLQDMMKTVKKKITALFYGSTPLLCVICISIFFVQWFIWFDGFRTPTFIFFWHNNVENYTLKIKWQEISFD